MPLDLRSSSAMGETALPVGGINRRTALVAGAAALLLPTPGRANPAFPERPLSLLVPANPGGGWDQLARLMQQVISEAKLSPKPVDVFNKGGAGGLIGLAEIMTRRHDDPYTIIVAGLGLIGSAISQHSPFMASESKPLARLIVENLMVAVPPNSPYNSMEDLVAAIQADPASITWAGGSAGGTDHILVGLITKACGVSSDKVRFVAYSGGGEASSAIMGGQVTAAVAGYGEWKGLAEAGHIRVLATSAPERFDDKTVPILKEAGLDIVFQNWRGVFAAPGAPAYAIQWWSDLLREMTQRPEWRSFLAGKGWEDGYMGSEEFTALIDREERLYRSTLQQLGIGGSAGGNSPVGPWAFPKAVAVLGLAAGAGVIAEHVRAGPSSEVAPAGLEDDDEGGGPLPLWKRFVAGALLIPLFIVALHLVGFLIATPLFVLAVCFMMQSSTLKWDAVAGIGLTAATWLLFTKLLHVALP